MGLDSLGKTKLKKFCFNDEGVFNIKNNSLKGQNWPVVYILQGEKEAYIGETNNAYKRMSQHLENPRRKVLDNIYLLLNDSFNKSVTLDFENKLIQYMHADGKYILQNENAGQSVQHDYYQRLAYEETFNDLWNKLKKEKLVNKSVFEIINSEIFKYSPYKELTEDQFGCIEQMLSHLGTAINENTQKNMVICGGAGTGKTVLAIYFIKTLVDIIKRNSDFTNLDDVLPEDSPILQSVALIKLIQEHKDLKIGFMVPTPSFRATVKKVFKCTKGLKANMVIGPNDISRKDFDVLIVDEAHRLKRNKNLSNNGQYQKACKSLDLPKESTQIDWIMAKKRYLTVLFYDSKQRVKVDDALDESFLNFTSSATNIGLCSQLRIKGGDEYISFVNQLLKNENPVYKVKDYDFTICDNYKEMEELIFAKNEEYEGLCRILSGISYPWSTKIRTKNKTLKKDIDVDGDGKYLRSWNLLFNDPSFITDDAHKKEIGCIYTCQGYDLNYAGVILGPDIFYDTVNKKIDINLKKYYKRKTINVHDEAEAKQNVLNQYLVLLTRGIHGTFIYAVDKNLRDHLKSLVISNKKD